MIEKCIRIFIWYNILLLYSFNYNFKKLIFYWQKIKYVKIPFDLDDFPYIKKFEMLYKLKYNDYNCENLELFITNNTIPKIYPDISLKSIWTKEFINDIKFILSKINIINYEIKTSYKKFKYLYENMGDNYGDHEFNDRGWLSCNLIKDRQINKKVEPYFYSTIKIIEKINNFYGWLFVSVLKPGTNIPKHRGRYNHKLTCHIGIDGLNGAKFIIDGKEMRWSEEKYFVFNDFSYHEVIHDGKEDRIVLIFDLFHPELSIDEIKAIQFIEL